MCMCTQMQALLANTVHAWTSSIVHTAQNLKTVKSDQVVCHNMPQLMQLPRQDQQPLVA